MTDLIDAPKHFVSSDYAVIGNPIAHSRSPQIHAAFGEQTGTRLTYTKLMAEPDQFEASVRGICRAGWSRPQRHRALQRAGCQSGWTGD